MPALWFYWSQMLAFRFLVIGEAIAGGYTVISILLSFKGLFWRLIVILDMVINDADLLLLLLLPLLAICASVIMKYELSWELACHIGHNSATHIKHFCCVGNSSSGQEREHSCWLATNLWTSSWFLRLCDYSSYCWFCCSNNLLCASSLFSLCCPQSYFCCNTLDKLPLSKD